MVDTPEHVAASRAWQRELDGGGWGAVTWPDRSAAGASARTRPASSAEEQGRYAIPQRRPDVGRAMVGPDAHGPRHARPAGAVPRPDPAGRAALVPALQRARRRVRPGQPPHRAERDGDEWVVTGQKVWTSGAHHADWAILLARTDPGSSRHHGITYFLLDMRSPGIDVRPIVQINGAPHFNEVHLDEVRVAAPTRGRRGGRGVEGRPHHPRRRAGDDRLDPASTTASTGSSTGRQSGRHHDDPVLRQELADAYIRAAVLGLTGERVLSAVRSGGQSARRPACSSWRCRRSWAASATWRCAVLGPEGCSRAATPTDEPATARCRTSSSGSGRSRIGGGTEQIQRNLIGERALGLPRDPSLNPRRPKDS